MNLDIWAVSNNRPLLLILTGLAIIIIYMLLRLYQIMRWRRGPRWLYPYLFKENEDKNNG